MINNGWMDWSGGDTMQDGYIGRWKRLCGMSMMIEDEDVFDQVERPIKKEGYLDVIKRSKNIKLY